MEEGKVVLDPETLAKEMGVSVRLIYRQLRANTIPHVKLGDRYFIGRGWLEKVRAGEIVNAGKPANG